MLDEKRAAMIEAQVTEYVHRAKRMTIDIFGADTTHDHNALAVQLAAAMVNLDAADRYATAHSRLILKED